MLEHHAKLLLNMAISNTALLQFGLAKSDWRQSPWPKVKFKKDFLNIFHFTLPFSLALFKRWINNKLKSYTSNLYFIFSIIFYNTLLYSSLTKRFEIMMGAKEKKTLDLQCQNRTMSSGKPRALSNMHVFVAYKIDVVNKQLVSPLSWNNRLLEN